MRNYTRIFICFLLMMPATVAVAQQSWTETGNKENAPDVAVEANYTRTPNGDFVVIYDDRSSYGEQRAKVKRYNGKSWSDVGEEAISPGRAIDMSVAECNGKLYAVFREWPEGKTFIKSFDGKKWNSSGEFAYTTDNRLVADGSKLYFVCYAGGEKTGITVYLLEGTTWKEKGALEKDSNAPFDVQVSNGFLHIAYTVPGGNRQARVRMLDADGAWVEVGPMVTDFAVKHIRLAFDNGIPVVAVYSDKDYNIYVKKIGKIKDKDNKDKWAWVPLGPDNGIAVKDFDDQLNFLMVAGKPYIVYEQSRSDKMRGVTLSGNGWVAAGADEYLSSDTDAGLATRLIPAPDTIYALFKDPNNNGVAIKALRVK